MEQRETPFPHRVVRHRRARRMTLSVGPAGVRLTVPPRAPRARIEAFLRAQAPWVEEQRRRLAPPPRALRDGDRLALLDGELVLRVRPGGPPAVAVREGGALVAGPRDAGAAVERWYRAHALDVLGGRARAAAGRLGAEVAAVGVRDPRSRWGSCSAAGRLSFSWRLVLAPEAVLDHVVAHEVCHLLRPDHSPAFWRLLAEVDPGHRAARAWLAERGHLLHRGPAWRAEAGVSPA